MTSKARPPLLDPGYDSVREICASLGYKSDTKNERHFKILSTRTANHRKKYLENSLTMTDFPLSNVAPEVQACAVQFLDEHRHLFQDTGDARTSSWPIYPTDKSRILSGIAKLMCAQEYLGQKNARDKVRDRVKQFSQQSIVDHENYVDPLLVVDANLQASISDTGAKSLPTQRAASVLEASTDSDGDSENEDDIEELQKNIDIHLDYVYPLNHSKDGTANDWLFTSEKCPDDVEPFAFRYLHEHNLYNSKAENIDAIHKFSKDLKLQLDVMCAPSKDHKIFKRCEQLVQRATRKWDAGGYGFLLRKNGVPRKTPFFEHAWMHHRKKWIEEIHRGVTAHLLEIPAQHPSSPTGGRRSSPTTSKKRPAEDRERMPESLPTTEAGSSKRRSQESSITLSPSVSGPLPTVVESAHHQSARGFIRAPEAVMVNLGPISQLPSLTQPGLSRPISLAAISDSSQGEEQGMESTCLGHNYPSNLRSTFASVPAEPLGLVGSSYHAPFHIDSPPLLKAEPVSPAHHTVTPTPVLLRNHDGLPAFANPATNISATQKPKLYFAIENAKGMPDTSKSQLVSGPMFRDSSLEDFFNLVSYRSMKAISSLHDITLRYTWIDQNAAVVNKGISEEAWEDIKEDVLDFFRMSREDNSARRRFHIWVRAGDYNKAGENASKDDI